MMREVGLALLTRGPVVSNGPHVPAQRLGGDHGRGGAVIGASLRPEPAPARIDSRAISVDEGLYVVAIHGPILAPRAGSDHSVRMAIHAADCETSRS